MVLAQYFQSQRFIHLLKKDVLFDQRKTLLIAGATFIVLLVTLLLWAYWGESETSTFFNDFFPFLLFFGGIIYTSFAFKELDNQNTGMLYLSLPASNFEKFLSKFLITTIGFVFGLIITWWLFSIIAGGLVEAFFDAEVYPFTPFEGDNELYIKVFFIVQSVFFLGAVSFRKYAAVKTIVASFVIQLILSLVILIIVRIVFFDFFDGFTPQQPDENLRPSMALQDFAEGPLTSFGKFLFWIVTPLFFWTVSYFKLKEQEI